MTIGLGEAEAAPRGEGVFFVRVNFVLFTHVVVAVLALAINVALFRELGADGKGHYTLFTLATTIGAGVGSLGVGLANVYYIGRRRHPLSALIAGSEFLVGALTALVVAIVAALALTGIADPLVGDLPLWLFALSIPMTLQLSHLASVLQARHQFGALNFVGAVIPAGTVAAIALMALLGEVSLDGALIAWVASHLAANLVAVTAIGWDVFIEAFPFWPSRSVLGEQVRFGLQGDLGNLLQLVNYRFDFFVVAAYENVAAAGVYSVAVVVAEGLWLLSSAVVVVLTPRLTGADEEDAAEFAPFVCRTVLLVSGLLAMGLAAASPFLVRAFFGAGSDGAVVPMLWLLPGVVAMSSRQTLASYILSRGRPLLNTVSAAVTVMVTLALDLILIPAFGIAGAAIASTVAYTATFALALFWFGRLSGRSPWTAVVARREDLRTYAIVLRRLRVRPRPAARSA